MSDLTRAEVELLVYLSEECSEVATECFDIIKMLGSQIEVTSEIGSGSEFSFVLDLEVKSVKKKFKDKSFASGVNRQIVKDGCEMLGMSLDEVIKETIEGMKTEAEAIGLKGNL